MWRDFVSPSGIVLLGYPEQNLEKTPKVLDMDFRYALTRAVYRILLEQGSMHVEEQLKNNIVGFSAPVKIIDLQKVLDTRGGDLVPQMPFSIMLS